MNLFIGIDPGLTGAVAGIDSAGDVVLLDDLPTIHRGKGRVKRELDPAGLAHILRPLTGDPSTVIVEAVASRPGQGVASVFSLGHTLGAIVGVLAALGMGYQLTPPGTWKKAMQVSSDKDAARATASRLFPAVDLRRKRDHNQAEALLMAAYARHRWRAGID